MPISTTRQLSTRASTRDSTRHSTQPSGSLLVAIHGIDEGEIVLDKAHRIARGLGIPMHVLQVVYDAFADLSIHEIELSERLRQTVLRASQADLLDLLAPLPSIAPVTVTSAVVWHKQDWQAILDSADKCAAKLIIKSVGRRSNVEKVLGRPPADWHLLRQSKCPVLFLTPANWQHGPVILAAIDVNHEQQQALNTQILQQAAQLAGMLQGNLHVVGAFPSVERWLGPITVAIDFERVRQNVESQTRRKIQALLDELEISAAEIHAIQGEAARVIDALGRKLDSRILVMGTVQKHGSATILLGNTSEQMFYRVRSDVLVVVAREGTV